MKYMLKIYEFLDSRPVYLYGAVFLLFGAVRLTMLQWDPIGLPDDHDEHCNLFQAETFAKGNLANPPHPLWQHFETFHILHNPSYASKYPPGQALFLYLGIKFFGHAWYGVLLSCMIMTCAVVWMIRGYCSTKWAIVVGLFIIVRYGIWNYWASSYWGGAVAATGGALVFGSLPRLKSAPRSALFLASLLFGLGLTFLSQTRPFEGLVVSLIPLLFFIKLVYKTLVGKKYQKAMLMSLPFAIVMVTNFSLTAVYNHQVTGSYLKTPYQLHREQYGVQAPLLILKNNQAPSYNHVIFSEFYNGWEVVDIKPIKQYLTIKKRHFLIGLRFLFYWPLLVGLTFLFIYSEKIMVPWWSFLVFCLVFLITPWFAPHYFAPILGVYYLLLVKGVQYTLYNKNIWVRNTARVAIPLFLVITLFHAKYFADRYTRYINGTEAYVNQKQKIIEQLNVSNEKHLILVKYGTDHKLNEEWVYNGPDLFNSKILWAHYISESKNAELQKFYPDRKVWLIQPDEDPLFLEVY